MQNLHSVSPSCNFIPVCTQLNKSLSQVKNLNTELHQQKFEIEDHKDNLEKLVNERTIELQEKIGLVPILRAGLGMVEGVWGFSDCRGFELKDGHQLMMVGTVYTFMLDRDSCMTELFGADTLAELIEKIKEYKCTI